MRHMKLGAVLAVALLALTGCATGGGSENEAGNDSGELTTLRIAGYQANFSDLAALVAEDEGFFEDEGLRVEVTSFNSGSETVAATLSGDIDMSTNSGLNQMIINANSPSAENQLVKIYSITPAASWELLASAEDVDPSASLKDQIRSLKGKTIGVPAVGSEGENIVKYLAEWAGLDPETDFDYLAVGLGAQAVSSYISGQIDAVVALIPVTALFENEGAVSVFNMATQDEIPELSRWDFASYMTTVNNTEKPGKDEAFKAFIRAMDSATEFLRDQDNLERAGEIWAKYNTTLSQTELTDLLRGSVDQFTGVVDCAGVQYAADLGVKAGLITPEETGDCDTLTWEGASDHIQR